MMLAAGLLHDFVACYASGRRRARRQGVVIDPRPLEMLEIGVGDTVLAVRGDLREINFDGIVGPSHNYAGLSLGNLASTRQRRRRVAAARGGAAGHRQDAREPRARPGPGHFRAAAAAGPRVARRAWHRRSSEAEPPLAANAMSASSMWAANAATVSPGARHCRRQMPPDRRQPADHAAPQPRMAGDAGPAAARVRGARPSRCTGRCRRHSATKARPITCGWRHRMASPGSRCSSMA